MSIIELNRPTGCTLNIPQELINTVIDLNKDDATTLLNCALVSSRFTARCQEHLFHKIRLSAAYGPRGVIRLGDVLATSPHLAHFIHTLVIEQLWTRSVDAVSSWLYKSQALGAVLMQLSCLRDLTLKGYDMCELYWDEFPEALQEALKTVMKNGCMRRLVLSFVTRFPLRYIVVPSLTDVELVSSPINMELTPLVSESPVQLSRWRSFYFEGNEGFSNIIRFIMSPHSGIDLSDLQKLVIRPVYYGLETEDIRADWVVLSQLLQRVSHCLQYIWISPSTWTAGGEGLEGVLNPQFSLGYLPRLQTFNIDLQLQGEELIPQSTLSYIWHVGVLENVEESQLPQLTTINVVCNFVGEDPTVSFDPTFWEQLDWTLSRPPLQSAKRVNILYLFDWFQPGELEPMADIIRQNMRRLMEKGVLHVAGTRGRIQHIPPSEASKLVD